MIIYQMALRTFAPEGTFRAAEARLEHVASLLVDVIYLCPFFRADADEDRTTWSPRQIASKTENPKNPYKIADYFHVDEEYGTDEDLISFVHRAHALGMKVIFDLVYLHCGKNAVFIKEHPDFVLQNPDGSPIVGESWPFARLNFENPALREYLYRNMEMLVVDFGGDGFRSDVGDEVPLDFWREAFLRLRAIKPDLLTINEGSKSEYLSSVFDKTYGYWASPMRKIATGASVSLLRKEIEREKKAYGTRVSDVLHGIDNHDEATNVGARRNELEMTSRGVEAMMVICTLYGGTPFLWNGYEFADHAENCMFSNRFYGKRSAMDWSCAFTADGQRRLSFVKDLHRLYHAHGVFAQGECVEIPSEYPDDVFVFIRNAKEDTVLVAVNCKNFQTKISVPDRFSDGEALMSADAAFEDGKLVLSAFGYLVLRTRNS